MAIPFAFSVKKLRPKLLNSSTYVRELCAITSAVKKWRTYLLGRKFLVYTDQRSLHELMTQIIQTPEQQLYLSKLLGYTYKIIYKPRAQNRVADALSRLHDNPATCLAIIVPQWTFLDKLQQLLTTDQTSKILLQQVQQNHALHPDFQIKGNLLFHKNKLFIPDSAEIKHMLLEEFHASQLGGHSGISKTYGRLKKNVFWVGMKNDITTFVNACSVCQQIKTPNHLPYGLLQP